MRDPVEMWVGRVFNFVLFVMAAVDSGSSLALDDALGAVVYGVGALVAAAVFVSTVGVSFPPE